MPISYNKQDHIGIITLSRPEARNAWGDDFNEGLVRHCAEMEDDDDIRCVVLTGDDKGGAFSAGANLKNPRTHTLSSTADFIKSLPKRKDRPFEVLSNFSKPLVGAVNQSVPNGGCHRLPWAFYRHTVARRAWPAGSARDRPCGWPWASR